ncbi:PAS domain S-box protein [candidate division KSB1 bacterium]|nr:PAS domain S-box protein [candidate division KSB1 bacterium]
MSLRYTETLKDKRLAKSPEKAESHLEKALDKVNDGISILKNNKIVWFNRKLCEILGYDQNELYGSYIARIFPDKKKFDLFEKELFFAISEKGQHQCEIECKHKMGELIYIHCSIFSLDGQNNSGSETLMILNEISEKKKWCDQMMQSERLVATGKLAASLAHEINNPLQGIMASLEMIRSESNNEEVNKSLDIADAGLKRISNIVNRLLDLHRPEFSRKRWIDVNQAISEVLFLTNCQLARNKIKVKKNLAESLPRIFASSQQFHQILINLILNAQDSMPDGGDLQLVTSQNGSNIIVKVIDQGKGIDPQDLPHIFDPFFSTKKQTGTGLGLSVVYSAVESHAGKVIVSSEPNIGTEFKILLPIKSE